MTLQQIAPGVHELSLGMVNVWLVEDGERLALVDTGVVGSERAILDAAAALGRQPGDIANIVLTHCHPDHAGSLAALKRLTGARAWMHRLDAEVVRGHTPMTRSMPAPGLLNQILYRMFIKSSPGVVPQAEIEHEITDGQILPIAGGMCALHTPGHSGGHLALLLQSNGLLMAGDTCSNMPWLAYSVVYDDLAEGRRSLAKLATQAFDAVCFGHGRALDAAGAQAFRKKWA
jgi:glyoxylase-like metal-dependent hydrolase (beta-lactamase superfamily II)